MRIALCCQELLGVAVAADDILAHQGHGTRESPSALDATGGTYDAPDESLAVSHYSLLSFYPETITGV